MLHCASGRARVPARRRQPTGTPLTDAPQPDT